LELLGNFHFQTRQAPCSSVLKETPSCDSKANKRINPLREKEKQLPLELHDSPWIYLEHPTIPLPDKEMFGGCRTHRDLTR